MGRQRLLARFIDIFRAHIDKIECVPDSASTELLVQEFESLGKLVEQCAVQLKNTIGGEASLDSDGQYKEQQENDEDEQIVSISNAQSSLAVQRPRQRCTLPTARLHKPAPTPATKAPPKSVFTPKGTPKLKDTVRRSTGTIENKTERRVTRAVAGAKRPCQESPTPPPLQESGLPNKHKRQQISLSNDYGYGYGTCTGSGSATPSAPSTPNDQMQVNVDEREPTRPPVNTDRTPPIDDGHTPSSRPGDSPSPPVPGASSEISSDSNATTASMYTAAITPKCSGNSLSPRSPKASISTAAAMVRLFQESDPRGKIPPYSAGTNLGALKLALWVCSRPAIRSFCSLVTQRRSPDNTMRFGVDAVPTVGGDDVLLLHTLHHLKLWNGSTLFAKYAWRLYICRLANVIDGTKHGVELRVSSTVVHKCMSTLGWSKNKLFRHLAEGRAWNAVCGTYGEGLLAFLPLEKWDYGGGDTGNTGNTGNNHKDLISKPVDPADFRFATNYTLEEFHRLLSLPYCDGSAEVGIHVYISKLCQVGQAFNISLGGQEEAEFRWESDACININVADLEEPRLLTAIQPRPQLAYSIFNPEMYPNAPSDWAEDTDWPWPLDPTTHNVSGCQLCNQETQTCNCIITEFTKPKPRIKRYGQRGLGLQAVAQSHGQIAYYKDSHIGVLTGQIVPVGKGNPAWSLQLVRDDGCHNMVVGELDTKHDGNLFRLVNHSHEPVADVKFMTISGRRVPVLFAMQNIYDSMEITISYGEKYSTFGSCGCLCEEICNHPDRRAPMQLVDMGRGETAGAT